MIPNYFILVCINKVPVSLDAQGTLDIGLPTLDIYSDLALSTKLLINRRAIWATSILVPSQLRLGMAGLDREEEEEEQKIELDLCSPWLLPHQVSLTTKIGIFGRILALAM